LIHGIKWRLFASIISSLALLLVIAFRWQLVDIVTVFLIPPVLLIFWLLFIITGIFSLTCLRKQKSIGRIAIAPIAIQIITVLLIFFIPFTRIWLKTNFYIYKSQREEIINNINQGKYREHELLNNLYLIPLDHNDPIVSMGGNDIAVEVINGKKHLLFYTFRGILDNYSGFIYVPDGGDVSGFSDLNEKRSTDIRMLESNWYYVSHH